MNYVILTALVAAVVLAIIPGSPKRKNYLIIRGTSPETSTEKAYGDTGD